MRWDTRVVLAVGLALGLVIRLALIRFRGTADTFTYEDWATATRHLGLAHAYGGIYFPLEYQAFAAASWAASTFHVSFVAALKAAQLTADCGIALLLTFALARLNASRLWTLVYWLHPYTLAMYWLSYVDFQIGFLVILAIALLWLEPRWLVFAAAGIPLGAAFLMKPQMILVVALITAGIAIVLVAAVVQRRFASRSLVPLLLLVGPLVFFAGYSAYFYKNGYPRTHLLDSYRTVANSAPSLTANMPNIWYPVAFAEQRPGEPSYAVVGPHVLHTVGAAITLVLLFVVAVGVARRWEERPVPESMLLLVGFGALIAPMTETRAHENHLYLGWLVGVLVAAMVRRPRFTAALLLLTLVDFVNLFGIYAFGLNRLSRVRPFPWIARHYSAEARLVAAAVAICVFAVLLLEMWRVLQPWRRAATPLVSRFLVRP